MGKAAHRIAKGNIMTFQPSPYQSAIFDFVKNDNRHGIVEACAGSGKTTTNVKALKFVPSRFNSVFLAFNKHIATELQSRGVSCASTFHSLGNSNIRLSIPSAKFNQYKTFDLIDNVYNGRSRLDYDDKSNVAKVISLLKANLLEPTIDNAMSIISMSSSIHIDSDDYEKIAYISTEIFKHNDSQDYDFDDMIYWCAIGKVSCKQFDFIFVDECQDLNKAQITMAEKTLRQNGRMLLIGDPHQSIYAFRGAFVGIMDYMQHKINAIELPLSVSYRAPLSIVDFVNSKFPFIPFEPFENAISGSISTIDMDNFLEVVNPGDGIICRVNAPLVKPCFALIRQGIKATILGRDIGSGLISLINRRAKLQRVEMLKDLIRELYVYFENEKEKLEIQKNTARITSLEDQIATIIAISDGCNTIDEVKEKIKQTFSDDNVGIVFSSIHKAKGLEWNNVYILEPQLLPHPMAQSDTDKEQEQNIYYVAVTRTKENLFFVR